MKTKSQRGFTLLEVVFALLLFSFVMGLIWFFYNAVYINNIRFNTSSQLTESVRTISNTIKNDLRLADYITVEIEQEDGSIKSINPGHDFETITGKLSMIHLYTKDKPQLGYRTIQLIRNDNPKHEQGAYSLIYKYEDGTNAIICDQLQDIKVTVYKGNTNIYFDCTVESGSVKVGEEMTLDASFSESLKNKKELTSR